MAADPVLDGIETTGLGVAGLLRTSPDLQAAVPKMTWNMGEVGAHLTSVLQAYRSAAEGGPPIGADLRFTAANNARLLLAAIEVSPEAQADSLQRAIASFVAANGALGREDLVPWYGEMTITARTASGLMLGELLVHGYDLKGALAQVPSVDVNLARLAVGAYAPALALMVDPDVARGMTVTFEIRKAAAEPFYLVIEDGVRVGCQGANLKRSRLPAEHGSHCLRPHWAHPEVEGGPLGSSSSIRTSPVARRPHGALAHFRLSTVPSTDATRVRPVADYLPLRSRCLHPGQQQGRRWPSSSSSWVRRMRRSRVISCLASSTQQMNSLRARGVMSFQALSAVGLATRALRRSPGSLCTTPPGSLELLTESR